MNRIFWTLIIIISSTSCSAPLIVEPTTTPILTLPFTPTYTSSATLIKTNTPTITNTPKATITEIPIYLLGSPFSNCGDGIARIWSNDSYNGIVPSNYDSKMDQHHGHVDIMRPQDCNSIIIYAPVDGYLQKVGNNNYDITLNTGIRLGLNTSNSQEFESELRNILVSSNGNQIVLKMAHWSSTISDGNIKKGQEIGKMVMEADQWKIAYQITTNATNYKIWSPTLFMWDKQPTCIPDSPYDCIPELNDYAQ